MTVDRPKFTDTVAKIREVKKQQADLQQEEHRLFNELLSQMDEFAMSQLKDTVFGTESHS